MSKLIHRTTDKPGCFMRAATIYGAEAYLNCAGSHVQKGNSEEASLVMNAGVMTRLEDLRDIIPQKMVPEVNRLLVVARKAEKIVSGKGASKKRKLRAIRDLKKPIGDLRHSLNKSCGSYW